MNTVEAWQFGQLLHRLPDTPDFRMAFLIGARHGLTRAIDAPAVGDDEDLLVLNEELIAFRKSIYRAVG